MTGDPLALPKGDPRLLETPLARRLLDSTIPARLAYVARDGAPRITPTWFHWTGSELVMPTFIAAPHVARPARRLRDLAVRPTVAVTIDTEAQPPHGLSLRGDVVVSEHDGVVAEYALAARRFLGEEAAAPYLAMLDAPQTRMARIALTPAWVDLVDFERRLPDALGGIRPESDPQLR
jgi:hypothetical protein